MLLYCVQDIATHSHFCYVYIYLKQGGYVIGGVCLPFCLSFRVQDYWNSNKPISLKLGVMIGLMISIERTDLTFNDDPVRRIWIPDHFSVSLTIAE